MARRGIFFRRPPDECCRLNDEPTMTTKPGVILYPQVAESAEALFIRIRDETSWDQRMRARKTASFGVAYNYSGIEYPDVPMPAHLLELAQRVAATVGHPINNCLVNFYPDGLSTMGFHSD